MKRTPVDLAALARVAAAAADGDGLPDLVRAVAALLGASVAVRDEHGTVHAVAARSSADEQVLLGAGGDRLERTPLTSAGVACGVLLVRRPAAAVRPPQEVERLIGALIAERLAGLRAPERPDSARAERLLRRLGGPDRLSGDELAAEVAEFGVEVAAGVILVAVRARVLAAEEEDWRERVGEALARAARAVSPRAIAGAAERGDRLYAEALAIVPVAGLGDDGDGERAAARVVRELEAALPGHALALGRSRVARTAVELGRIADEALLAINVAEGAEPDEHGHRVLAFEDSGSYRLLLGTLADDPAELKRFYAETIAPLAAYDAQYETTLVLTLVTYLEADGSVAGTAQRLFTHRHTIRYRLERVRELSGLDVGSSDGRERLGLGLKAMRVLGIAPPPGPPRSD